MNIYLKTMRKVSRSQIVDILQKLDIHSGDGLLVHSALQFLGLPEGGPGLYLDALQAVLGPQGPIAFPAFNFAFAKGEDYDPQSTPSVGMGAFSEYVRLHPESLRTSHPMQSLSIIGKYAADLTNRDTPSAFDHGSVFDRMLELDFKLLLLGADIEASSVTHYSELRAEAPYRYWKEFTGRVRLNDKWEMRAYRMYVRDLEIDPQLTAKPVQAVLESKGLWSQQCLNYGFISVCRIRDFIAATDEILAKDPWGLVTNRPVVKSSS